jgi:hypothetical protein
MVNRKSPLPGNQTGFVALGSFVRGSRMPEDSPHPAVAGWLAAQRADGGQHTLVSGDGHGKGARRRPP